MYSNYVKQWKINCKQVFLFLLLLACCTTTKVPIHYCHFNFQVSTATIGNLAVYDNKIVSYQWLSLTNIDSRVDIRKCILYDAVNNYHCRDFYIKTLKLMEYSLYLWGTLSVVRNIIVVLKSFFGATNHLSELIRINCSYRDGECFVQCTQHFKSNDLDFY